MKKYLLLTFGLLFFNSFGQSKISCYEKEYCKITSEDTSECTTSKENSFFKINRKETSIIQITGNVKTLYFIDSKLSQQNLKTQHFTTHTQTGERLNISINPKTISIMSLDFPEIKLAYKIKAQ